MEKISDDQENNSPIQLEDDAIEKNVEQIQDQSNRYLINISD